MARVDGSNSIDDVDFHSPLDLQVRQDLPLKAAVTTITRDTTVTRRKTKEEGYEFTVSSSSAFVVVIPTSIVVCLGTNL